jgi:RNA polymerase sigma-70 factor (ECF subfamily)
MKLVRPGDDDADATFAALYREHAGRVYALCLRLTGDAARARDLTQDVFVRAWENLDSFRGESALASWLHRVTVNVALSAWRNERRRTQRVETRSVLPDAPSGEDGDPERHLDLDAAIATLPHGARTVFVLHDVQGYRHDEIAAMTGMAVGTSKAHLFRARRLLRQRLNA